MSWNVPKFIISRHQWTSITNRVLILFDRFTASYKCKSWNVNKLITPRVPCKSITNRVLCIFDRFTAFYNRMTWNLRKLTIITNRVLSLTEQFRVLYNCMSWYVTELLTPMHIYHKSCFYPIWAFYAFLQLYVLKYQKTHNSTTSVNKYHISCS